MKSTRTEAMYVFEGAVLQKTVHPILKMNAYLRHNMTLTLDFPWVAYHLHVRASLVAQTVKNLPAKQETWVQSLGQEDSLAKGVAIHFSLLIQRIPWTEEPGRL